MMDQFVLVLVLIKIIYRNFLLNNFMIIARNKNLQLGATL